LSLQSSKANFSPLKLLKSERNFFIIVALYLASIFIFSDNLLISSWLACGLALYSVIANDSIQTIGTFLYSNSETKKIYVWGFLSTIFLATIFYGWHASGGSLDFGRLAKIPEPTSLNFMHKIAPLMLLVLTRFKIPLSTTFLILCLFSSSKTIESMLIKSGAGYIVSFISAATLVLLLSRFKIISPSSNPKWRVLQVFTTAFLWYTWLTHDVANIVVFLPRQLPIEAVTLIGILGVIGLAMLVWLNGGRIQEIVRSKSNISDYKSATIVDLLLACILFYFKEVNSLPMSTTFVFLGVLGGRELALTLGNSNFKSSLAVIFKDISLATIGIILSLLLAAINSL